MIKYDQNERINPRMTTYLDHNNVKRDHKIQKSSKNVENTNTTTTITNMIEIQVKCQKLPKRRKQ